MSPVKITNEVHKKITEADVLVPAPLMIDRDGRILTEEQKLITLYYLEAGVSSVIVGAHTGQFARADIDLYRQWLDITAEVIDNYADHDKVFKMAAIGGPVAGKMLEVAKDAGYELAMVAPTSLKDSGGNYLSEADGLKVLREYSEVLPLYGFYLQQAVGGRDFSQDFWSQYLEFAAGAKAAPFDRKKTDDMMRAAAASPRLEELVMATGNDDHIVGDFLLEWENPTDKNAKARFDIGLLGHFASDTHAAVKLIRKLKNFRQSDTIASGSDAATKVRELAADVTAMNHAVFDTSALPGSPAFENCVYGVHYRLLKLGLTKDINDIRWNRPDGSVRIENGRPGLDKEIDINYDNRPHLTDNEFVSANLAEWKNKLGI